MYIAMNRFRVVRGSEDDFENIWRNRDSHLSETEGFLEFKMLRGAEAETHTLFVSHSVWASEEAFMAWMKSPKFRASHKDAGDKKPLYLEAPRFEGFSIVEGA